MTAIDAAKSQWRIRLPGGTQPAAGLFAGRVVTLVNSLGRTAHAVTAAQRDGDDLVLTTQDDLLAGVLRVTGVRGARLDTRTRLPLAASYVGACVLDDRFRVIGRIRGGDQDHLELETEPAGGAALVDHDVWVCSVGPGDRLELPAVFTWQR